MTMVRGAFPQLLATGAHAVFVEWRDIKQREPEFEKIFNVETSTKAFEDEFQMVGMGPMPEAPENTPTAYFDGIQAGIKRYLHLTYRMGSRASWELVEDDQYGIINKVPEAHVKSARFTQEMVAANIFNQGFTSIVSTDGVSLFNTAHPLVGGVAATNTAPGITNVITAAGTYPNRPTPDVDLSITGLQFMANVFERFPDSQGLPSHAKPKFILIPPEQKFIARELLGSAGKPYTADNEINALLGEDLTFMVSHYLTSQSAWFALADKGNHQLKFFWRKKLDAKYDDDFDTGALKTISYMRFSCGATHWINTYGSNGP